MRKTIQLVRMIEKVNHMNCVSTCSEGVRQGWNTLLEDMLHDAGAYAGFNYLRSDEVPVGEKPGIIVNNSGRNEYPDETRRVYYKGKLSN